MKSALAGLAAATRAMAILPEETAIVDLAFTELEKRNQSVDITSNTLEPSIDMRNAEVFNRTLFTRDDRVLEQLNAGIDAGRHEGCGKSLEIRRFGFHLDHGGVNGGLKVLVDDVQRNQGTQGHGQGYLGALKALSPELIQEATIINGLGVVDIRRRESLPDQITMRLQGGNFDTGRGLLAVSPNSRKIYAYAAFEGTYTNGPFLNAGRYRRDNVNANFTRSLTGEQKIGFRLIFGRPRSLFDLYSNFTFTGMIPFTPTAPSSTIPAHKIGGLHAMLVSGANFHDNEINVGIYPMEQDRYKTQSGSGVTGSWLEEAYATIISGLMRQIASIPNPADAAIIACTSIARLILSPTPRSRWRGFTGHTLFDLGTMRRRTFSIHASRRWPRF